MVVSHGVGMARVLKEREGERVAGGRAGGRPDQVWCQRPLLRVNESLTRIWKQDFEPVNSLSVTFKILNKSQ